MIAPIFTGGDILKATQLLSPLDKIHKTQEDC